MTETKTTARDKILAAATTQMLSKGYAAARVDEICAAAGVSKGSFYHFFRTKEDIGREALVAFFREATRLLLTGPFTRVADPTDRLFVFLDHVEDVAGEIWGQGSLLGGFAVDLADTNPDMRDEVSRMYSKLTIGLADLFEPVVDRHGALGDPTALELAEQFLVVVEGGIVLARAHADPGRIFQGLRIFRRELERMVAVGASRAGEPFVEGAGRD